MKTQALQKRIGTAIRTRRQALGISQEAFADKIHMHRAYYGALERGEKNLQVSTLARVCAGLGKPMADIIAEAEKD